MDAQVNWLDIIVIGILVVNGFIAYQRGFIITVYRLTYLIIGGLLTKAFYPIISNFVRFETGIYQRLVLSIKEGLKLDVLNNISEIGSQISDITKLGLPSFLQQAIIENNNPEVYKLLNVDKFGDYIAGYLANISINIISMIVAFVIISIGLKFIVKIFDLIAKLPVLNSINKLGGLAVGLLLGIVMIWIGGCIITLFYTSASFESVVEALENSVIAKYLYDNNFIAQQILQVIYK